MSANPVGGPPPKYPLDEDRKVGDLVIDVTERVTILVREEIELAKVELTEKLGTIARGSAVGIAAGVFVLMALAMLMHAVAWLINDILGIESAVWVGFLLEALILLVLAGLAGWFAYKTVKKGTPPTPVMAIEEIKETKATLGGDK
ncbi:MAG: phage holin family protein [Solirubrobacterales bacterium]|nr:phage holin family protein [Solirubrobacterales bacterium]